MRESAGLPLSVGNAPIAIRLFLATVALTVALICGFAGRLVAGAGTAGWILGLLVEPVAIVCAVGAAFIAGPYSRFGVWLDHFVPQLRRPLIAMATAAIVVLISIAVMAS